MNAKELQDFAERYAEAWCSQNAASVAAFYEEDGSLRINGGSPSTGRIAITAAAQAFMTAFPDMVVSSDEVTFDNNQSAIFKWTLSGTNTGPGGTHRPVRISGYEQWTFGPNALVLESKGHFDEIDYQRQLTRG